MEKFQEGLFTFILFFAALIFFILAGILVHVITGGKIEIPEKQKAEIPTAVIGKDYLIGPNGTFLVFDKIGAYRITSNQIRVYSDSTYILIKDPVLCKKFRVNYDLWREGL